jgi:RNA polymerase sigma-70 factor (ECF subfamily)
MAETFWLPAEYQSRVIASARTSTPRMIEAEIIEMVGAGRRDAALAAIVRAYKRKVFGLALSYLRDREAAEDVAQEVFIKVWKALPQFDGRATVSTWIYTITRNTSFSTIRARRPNASLSDPDVMAAVETSGAAAGEESAEVEGAALLRLVDQLPAKQRQVVMLFYMEEQSHEEVANMLAMPVGTVKTLLHRARARLQELQ